MTESQTSLNKAAKAPAREFFGALDGFRGGLALLIAVYHTIWLSHINSSDFLNNGQVLVDLFFVFSGFLMFLLYRGRLNTPSQAFDFIKRRIARIYPLHFVMLMVFVAFQAVRVVSHKIGISVVEPGEIMPFTQGAPETLASFFANLTLTQSMGFFDSLTFNPPAWTVSVEFYTYFVFLGMMAFFPPKTRLHFAIIAVMIATLYYRLSQLKPNMDFHYDYGFWRCLAGFYSGVLSAWLYRGLKAKTDMIASRLPFHVLEVFTLVVLYVFIVNFTGRLQFLFAPLAILFVLTFAIGRGGISTFMSTKIMLYLGKISYSIYLVHVLISIGFTVFAERILPGVIGANWNAEGYGGDLLLLPYLAVVIFVSHFTYKYVERPGQKAILSYRGSNRMRSWVGKPPLPAP